jgi:PII-like signaling protein
MVTNKEAHLLRIFVGESDKIEGRPLYEWIVVQSKEAGLAGATVLRGIMGFGANTRMIHSFKIERLSVDLPIVIEIVDEIDKLDRFLEMAEKNIGSGLLATMEKVQVRFYRPSKSDAD